MNRDIEFRVWDDHYKYMNYKVIVGIYGNWEEVKDNENYTACSMWIEPKNVDYKCEPHWSHFEPYHKEIKLMQYTGLKDKNGKKIFERDIVIAHGTKFIIKFGSYRTQLFEKEYGSAIHTKQFGWYAESIENKTQCNLVVPNDIEVIGNIYENKELLEG